MESALYKHACHASEWQIPAPFEGSFARGFGNKYKCKTEKPRRNMENGKRSGGFVMTLQTGSRMQTPRLEDVSEMAVN